MAELLGKNIKKSQLLKCVGNMSQLAYIRPYELIEGKAKGLKALDVCTGSGLDFTVLEDKCLDIFSMRYKGIPLQFVTKPGLVASQYWDAAASEFGRSFQGGMLYTCGLTNVGPACDDNGSWQTVHGRIGHTPAENVHTSTRWEEDEFILEIGGEMRQAALFSENLMLRRKLTTHLGSKSVLLQNEIENQGFEAQECMILFHFNAGYPLLDACSRFVAPLAQTIARDDEAQKGLHTFDTFTQPINGFQEQVFYHQVKQDAQGMTAAAIINDELKLGLYIKYNATQLPRLIQWKSMNSGDYALGIEPANCLVENRINERKRGTLQMVQPQQTLRFDLEIGILDGDNDIRSFETWVKSL